MVSLPSFLAFCVWLFTCFYGWFLFALIFVSFKTFVFLHVSTPHHTTQQHTTPHLNTTHHTTPQHTTQHKTTQHNTTQLNKITEILAHTAWAY